MQLSREGSLGTLWVQQKPLTIGIGTENQWVIFLVVNLEKMNNLNNDSTKHNSMHLLF